MGMLRSSIGQNTQALSLSDGGSSPLAIAIEVAVFLSIVVR